MVHKMCGACQMITTRVRAGFLGGSFILLALLVSVSGCGHSGSMGGRPVGLDGTFVASQAEDVAGHPPFASPLRVQISFESHQIQWIASCNGYFGRLRVGSRQLKVTGIGATTTGCPISEAREDD